MSYMNEYIAKGWSPDKLEKELQRLVNEYNKITKRNLFIYCADMAKKQVQEISLDQDDYHTIVDLLSGRTYKHIDIYLETPGGSGTTAEDIVKFLRSKFDTVNFVIAGEAKSAGTILALSGDEILMTQTGALGPIDAQVPTTKGYVSASNYMEWVKEKYDEVKSTGRLNSVDAMIVAQINPGELRGVEHALNFAIDRVKEWLALYKFKDWTVTETNKKPVTGVMREERAKTIAADLATHSKWQSHGRSIKKEDLENLGLKIINIDNNKELAEVVYKIRTVMRLIFAMTNAYKILSTEEHKLLKHIANTQPALVAPVVQPINALEIIHKCDKCGTDNGTYLNPDGHAVVEEEMKKKGFTKLAPNGRFKCKKCGAEFDMNPAIMNFEKQTGRKLR